MRQNERQALSRRRFLKLGGGLVGLGAAATVLPRALLQPEKVAEASFQAQIVEPDLHFAATDGWIHLPEDTPVPPYHPDNMAPPLLTTYIFGFRNVTGLDRETAFAQKMKAQLTAPTWSIDQEQEFTLKLTNLGLQIRPDLIDAHTLHFHGFRNAIPIFDGEPHSSVGVPIARDLTYYYKPHHPGTYLYHCHFEETEHVHMGMVGVVFVRPELNTTLGGKFAYNDPSTEYDREFVMNLSEVWSLAHWCDSHVQLPEWSDYAPDFWMLNGRCYPDTLVGPGSRNPTTGDLDPPDGHPELQYQPISSLVRCNAGDRVLLRFVNLGYAEQSMRLAGIPMRVVGKDATPLVGRDGNPIDDVTDTVIIGPGESADAIFIAPSVSTTTEFLLHNRSYARLSNGGKPGWGGQMTKVIVQPSGVPDQTEPNT